MKVRITSVLSKYTDGKLEFDIEGTTLEEILGNLDLKFAGIKFRFLDEHNQIRPHMRIFVNKNDIRDITLKLEEGDEIFIVQSLSGG